MVLAAAALLVLFLSPMWRITLVAPQYPDGVTMYIWINKISGDTPGTLQNINILNHYIGMKEIVPESIPELKYFQFVVLGLFILGLLAAIVNKRKVYLGWVALLVILCALGIYDFYLWEYDYGHNLSDTAPMKFDVDSYQPPLFGKKNLLNFIAISYPHIGGWFIGVSILLGYLAFYFSKSKKSNDENPVHLVTSDIDPVSVQA
jgi:hypothetical protein